MTRTLVGATEPDRRQLLGQIASVVRAEADRRCFQEFVDGHCWSLWEGCMCGGRRGHTGLHVCAACPCSWTDAESATWEATLDDRA